jgi:invasion protein IalB
MRKLIGHTIAVLAVAAATGAFGSVLAAAAQEKPAEIIAAHIRTQGYECTKPLSAQRNRKASKPNEAAWTLRCSNAVYNVRLIPDMAAHVEKVDDTK